MDTDINKAALEQQTQFRFLFVGDSDCGKTRIIQTYMQTNNPIHTFNDSVSTRYDYKLEGSSSMFSIVDVRGIDDMAKASKYFPGTDVAVFFYAINRPRSLDILQYQWIPRFRMSCGYTVPTILVGSKKDLRASGGLRSIALKQPDSVSFIDGVKLKTSCRLDMFLECSAEDYDSISCLFQAAYAYVI